METNQHEDEQSLDGEYDDSEDEEEHEHEQDIQDQEDEDPGVVPGEEKDGDETDEEDAKSGETGSSDNHESARAHTKPKSHSSKHPKDRTVVRQLSRQSSRIKEPNKIKDTIRKRGLGKVEGLEGASGRVTRKSGWVEMGGID